MKSEEEIKALIERYEVISKEFNKRYETEKKRILKRTAIEYQLQADVLKSILE